LLVQGVQEVKGVQKFVASGFGRFKPREFAYVLRVARGSLFETRNHIQDGRAKKYFDEATTEELRKIQARAAIAATRLLRYLDSCQGKRDAPRTS
jgi:four helix bundle protein